MKKAITFATLFGTVTNAFAATGRQDDSGIFVWAFLGFCALIVVAQVIPALLMMFGLAKGITSKRELAHQTGSTDSK
ncbi:hypothetical protein LPW11_01825 [Geomonas sp. RF6]|uniref:hypothetical protein n=1 Tax=Geomonas sp. RF6 TaxID=2897342 RepID=UPI001E51B678|nr:hypothetical protein [Geomonas sp. RF6]UFS70935.1 hypothetical protein LPW11_01825 [Geomonas sp. RF6]